MLPQERELPRHLPDLEADNISQGFLPDSIQTAKDLTPILLYLVSPGERLTASSLNHYRSNCLQNDDVFQATFLNNVVFYGSKKADVLLDPDVEELLQAWKVRHWIFADKTSLATPIPSGPYIVGRGFIWQPWRIYQDFNNTLMLSFKPSLPDKSW